MANEKDRNIKKLLAPTNDPAVPSTHELVIQPRPVVPVRHQPRGEDSSTGQAPKGPKLWTAKLYFDSRATAEFHPERLDPVPELYDLNQGDGPRRRTQVMVLSVRCVGIDTREAVRHSKWLATIGPHASKQAIAKLLMERKADVELALSRLCSLQGEPAVVLPREGSVVGAALALVRGEDGLAAWRIFTWFVQRPQRPYTISFPEWGLLWRQPREWWERLQWYFAMREASRLLAAGQQAADRWMDPEFRLLLDLAVKTDFERAVTSLYAAANLDNDGLQRLLKMCDVNMAKTKLLPVKMTFEEMLAMHAMIVDPKRRANVGEDLGT